MDRGDSTLGLIGRISGRSASLLFFGVMMPGLLTRLFDLAGHLNWLWPLGKVGAAGAIGCAIRKNCLALFVAIEIC